MKTRNIEVALLVHTCDRYELLYQGFQTFFSKHWDFNVPCNYYFATEEKEVSIPQFENVRSGKGAWADRLLILLKEKITEDYLIYMQEDMWLNEQVDAGFFEQLFSLAVQHDWKQVKLHSASVYQTKPTELFIDGFNVTVLDNQNSDFLMSHQITLWNKAFLIEQLHKQEHPWRNERRGTKRLRKLNPVIQHIDYYAENGHVEVNQNQSAAKRSGYAGVSVNGMLNDNVLPFIQELLNGTTDERAYGLRLEHNHHHGLTHDGLPKPRKVDVFKRIKHWFLGR